MMELFSGLIAWYMGSINYFSIMVLMAIESTFIPLPSEIIIPPAAYLAQQGQLNIYLVILSGSVGATLGALFNYYMAHYLGRRVIYKLANTRWANFLLVDQHAVVKAENFFRKNANTSTFIGRLVPGIRHLISVPAGIVQMPIKKFLLFTFSGALLWNMILGAMGWYLGAKMDLIKEYAHQISIGFLICGALFFCYIMYKGFFGKKEDVDIDESENL